MVLTLSEVFIYGLNFMGMHVNVQCLFVLAKHMYNAVYWRWGGCKECSSSSAPTQPANNNCINDNSKLIITAGNLHFVFSIAAILAG